MPKAVPTWIPAAVLSAWIGTTSGVTFSRIQTRALALECSDFDVQEVIEEALDMMTYPAQTKGLELGALIEPDVPTRLRGDPARLRQVLLNLLGNAVKFTERGHVSLRVTCLREGKRNVCLQFNVCDTGCGVAELDRGSIFEAFTRGNGAAAGQLRSGIGLGLYIAKHLVEEMHGEISVDGVSEVGSTFWFTARFEKRDQVAHSSPQETSALRGQRVLIVEDSPLSRHLLVRYAEACGAIGRDGRAFCRARIPIGFSRSAQR